MDPQEPPRRPIEELTVRAALLGFVLALSGCGDKVPQSEAAKKIGDIPKQTLDGAKAGVGKAMDAGAQRLDEKKE